MRTFGLRCPGLDINAYLGRMLLYKRRNTHKRRIAAHNIYVAHHLIPRCVRPGDPGIHNQSINQVVKKWNYPENGVFMS